MGKRSRMSILKRQRELKKAEKAAQKRARRHGLPPIEGFTEPKPTISAAEILGGRPPEAEADETPGDESENPEEETQ